MKRIIFPGKYYPFGYCLSLKWLVFLVLGRQEKHIIKLSSLERRSFMQMQHFPFDPLTLPYPVDSLEPFFQKSLVSDHYQNFYLPQLNELNRLLKNCPALHSAVLGKLLCFPSHSFSLSSSGIRVSRGSVLPSILFFLSLSPPQTQSTGQG